MKSIPPLLIAASASLAVLGMTGCEKSHDSARWWQNEQERIEASHRLELQKFRFDRAYNQDFQTFESLRQANAERATSLKSLRERRLALTTDVDSMQGQWNAFRETVLRDQRRRALGATFDTLTLASGRKFTDVSVSAVNDGGVTIRHSDGAARLTYGDLDASQRQFFGLDADLALAAISTEKKQAVAYEQWVDDRMTIAREKQEKRELIAKREESAARKIRDTYNAQLLSFASEQRPLAQPPRTVSSRGYSSYGYYGRYNYYVPSVSTNSLNFNANTQGMTGTQRLGTEVRSVTNYGTP